MYPSENNSSTHITFSDTTSTAAPQPVIETTAPSGNLAGIMGNWVVVLRQTPTSTEHPEPSKDRGGAN